MLLEEIRRIDRLIARAKHGDVEMGPILSCPLIHVDVGEFLLLDDALLKHLGDKDGRDLGEEVIPLVFDEVTVDYPGLSQVFLEGP
jgi:hypothetical protein